ncbi:MAG TPA: formyltetrahydrofolate deformylase [Acidimicrobiia bacterium]|nr:formyltetrahydrofolate deformylase [Acidimicrobiia bacterium]
MTASAVLLLACPDRPGIVSLVSAHIAEQGGNILRAEQSESVADSHFYQRIHFNLPGASLDLDNFRAGFAPVAEELQGVWSVHAMDTRQKTAILVSRQPHCLLDLLGRWRVGDIPADLVAVISNHDEARDIAEGFAVPYHHLPVTPETRADQEQALDGLLVDLGVELVVLARYMQVLSDGFIERWAGKVINIHHSFLPAFPGAKPYHQAMERGVKLIGATAHYATADLDEGPIIGQGVTSTSHRDSVADFVRRGREVEARVLASAVRAHLEHRVIVAGRRTIVFE